MAGFLALYPDASKEKLRSGQLVYTALDSTWTCLITGPGVFNTAMGLGSYLEHHTPDLILNTGIAGAYEGTGLSVGDVAVATREQYLHTGIGNGPLSLSPLPFELIPGQADTREGIYGFDPILTDAWAKRLDKSPSPGSVFKGPFLTVSALTKGLVQADRIHQKFLPVMEAMEGAAAAHVCQCYRIPLIEIRAASNMAGERDKSRWDFPLACSRVTGICRSLLG